MGIEPATGLLGELNNNAMQSQTTAPTWNELIVSLRRAQELFSVKVANSVLGVLGVLINVKRYTKILWKHAPLSSQTQQSRSLRRLNRM